MMKTIALIALLVALIGLGGERFSTSTYHYRVSMSNSMSNAIGQEMAGVMVSSMNVCGTQGNCSAGSVSLPQGGIAVNATLFSEATDGFGNVAVWWNEPGGRYADVTNASLMSALNTVPAYDTLEPIAANYIAGYWTGAGLTPEGGNGAFTPAPTLIAAIAASGSPPAVGTPIIVYSSTG